MNDFAERFHKHSNSHLLKIVESKDEYQREAIEAAKNILESRQLTEGEIKIARNEIANEQFEKDAIIQRNIIIANGLKEFGASVVETIHPIKTTPPTINNSILITSIVFGLMSLYRISSEWDVLKFMFTNSTARWDFSMVVYFLPLLWIPLATILFYTRKKTGWVLLTAFISWSSMNILIGIYSEFTSKPSLIPAFDYLLPATSPVTIIGMLLFYGGCFWFVCGNNIRQIYTVDKKTLNKAIGTGALLAIVPMVL